MDTKQGPYPPNQGFTNPGAFPQTGFAGGQPSGYGAGYGAPPPAAGFVFPESSHTGYNMPPNESGGPKPYSNESGSSYGDDLHGIDFSEKTIRMAFIR